MSKTICIFMCTINIQILYGCNCSSTVCQPQFPVELLIFFPILYAWKSSQLKCHPNERLLIDCTSLLKLLWNLKNNNCSSVLCSRFIKNSYLTAFWLLESTAVNKEKKGNWISVNRCKCFPDFSSFAKLKKWYFNSCKDPPFQIIRVITSTLITFKFLYKLVFQSFTDAC